MALHVYNSLSEAKEEFNPIFPNKVSVYVCGPTVYSDTHLGHAKTYVGFDIIVRYLQYSGYSTFYVQNITDVGHLVGDVDDGEDKILKKAREVNQEPMAVVEKYTRQYFQVMDALGVQRPDISPRASGHIPEQIQAIETLIEKGHAYEVNGSVYFDVSSFPEYGKLSNRNTEELMTGTRIDPRSEKKHPNDFALWKKATEGHLMRWKDPWSGLGYPGWHTECCVMSTKYLGDTFDIHGGGMELKFPHHESEIAQAKCLNHSYANYWLHTNMLTIQGQKMSKSSGNYVSLEESFEHFDPLVIRYLIAASHYRSVLDYSDQALSSANVALGKLHKVTKTLRENIPQDAVASKQHFQKYRQDFERAMDDDFSTPQALAVLFDLTREVNALLQEPSPPMEAMIDAENLFSELGGQILGIIPTDLNTESKQKDINNVMNAILEVRTQFRKEKNFEASDAIRTALQKVNIQIDDSHDQTRWKWTDSK